MKTQGYLMSVLNTMLLAVVLAPGVDAQTPLNIGGSSTGRDFFMEMPLNVCDIAPRPHRYSSADGNKITWTCNRGGLPIIMRYSATMSSDGITKLLQPANNSLSNMLFLNHTLTAGCTGPVTVSLNGRDYDSTTSCSNSNVISLPVHIGASNVAGATFHQTGPVGTSITPLDDSGLNVTRIAAVPLSLFVGKGVKGVFAGAIYPSFELSQEQVQAVFSRSVTDWQRLGFGTVTDSAPSVLEDTSPITLCLRTAGSGTKAAFDELLMLTIGETSLSNANVIFSTSTSGVVDCLASNRRSVGYLSADNEWHFGAAGQYYGLARALSVNRYDSTIPFIVACGKPSFWTYWRLNRRTTSEGPSIDTLAQAFINVSQDPATLLSLRVGNWWIPEANMSVSKNADRGPLIWKPGNHPECGGTF